MYSQSHTVLLVKLAVATFLVGIAVPVMARIAGFFQFRRLSVFEGCVLAALVLVGALCLFKWIVEKHFNEY